MASPLKIKIQRGYVLAFILLLLSYLMIFYVIKKLREETAWVTHSYSVINTLHFIKAEITDAETGVRGYVISKDARFLQPYRSGSVNVMPLMEELKRLTADNTEIAPQVDTLEQLIKKRLAALSIAVEKFEENGMTIVPEMRVDREVNKKNMDDIRSLVGHLIDAEQVLREVRNERLQRVFSTTNIIAIISLIIAVIISIYSFLVYNRESKAREEADKYAKMYSQELEENVVRLEKMNHELQELKSIEKFASTGRIARTIAHEVRNPITNISLASEQLKEMTGEDGDASVLLEMIERNATRINQLVSELLNSTRFAQLTYSTFDITEIVDETLSLALDRIELNNIRVEKNYEKSPLPVRVDKEKIKLALLNIIVNALEAMENGHGLLQLKTMRQGDKCIVQIKDNGSGMNEETLQNLFEPYYTSKQKGNGLGLTNTQNIILNHGGSITVKSAAGDGAVFTVSLNIAKTGNV